FTMKIYCLDKPDFGLYRVRKVDEVVIPVKTEDNKIDKIFEGLIVGEVKKMAKLKRSRQQQILNVKNLFERLYFHQRE
ncbi:850_t:CDS:2, partial [Gigaspora rosea]